MEYTLEPLAESDRTAVIDIFNYFIDNSFAAYLDRKVPYEYFDGFMAGIGDYPAVTVKTEPDETVGFGFLRPYHKADTFRKTARITYFILPEHTGKGLGTRILEHFLAKARERHIDIFLASISSLNNQSIEFHKKHGFVECGRFKDIGSKHGKTFDVVWTQKVL